MDPFYGMLAQGGLSLLGGVLGRSRRSSMDKVAQGLNIQQGLYERDVLNPRMLAAFDAAEARAAETHQFNQTAFAERNSAIQRTVADARAAGLHPLFALGGAVNSSPAFSVDGGRLQEFGGVDAGSTFGTGSVARDAIAGLGDAVRMYMGLEDSRSRREVDSAQAAYYRAMAAKASQEANATRTMGYGREQDINWTALPPPGKPATEHEAHRRTYNTDRPLYGERGEWTVRRGARQEEVEEEYGGAIGELYGIWKAIRDAERNFGAELNFGDYPQ